MDGRVTKIAHESWEKVCQRCHGLDTELAKNAEPDSVISCCQLQSLELRDFSFIFVSGIFDKSDNG